jgi:glycosyltransferase involved in cell wall biosynthesis
MIKEPKVAIFYDWLNQWGGAERVLLNILKIFPESSVFTLIHNPKKTHWLPKNTKIITSFINKLPFSQKNPIFYTPLYSLALEQFDFSDFDIVISTTSISGHCLLTSPKTLFICYLHNINRYVHQTPKQFNYLKPLLNWYKKIDFIYGQRPDYLLCNSNTVKERILNNYQRSSSVVYPGVDISFFTPSKNQVEDKYFLVVSRLVKHKRVDLAIKACHKLGKKLIIVGRGREKLNLVKMSRSLNDPNIIFLGKINNHKLLHLYQNCQALICPQIEDFGLTPLEAQACGKPVIALKKGGITETVINGKTGIFFKNQTIKSLSKAIKKFDPKNFSSSDCIINATKFSTTNFMLNFKQIINSLWQKHQTITS